MELREMTMQAARVATEQLYRMTPQQASALLSEVMRQPEVYSRLLKWEKDNNRLRIYHGEQPKSEEQMAMAILHHYLMDQELAKLKAAQP